MANQMELIGDNKIGILDEKVNSVDLCRQIALNKNNDGDDEAFILVNLDVVFERFALWKRELPMVEVRTQFNEHVSLTFEQIAEGLQELEFIVIYSNKTVCSMCYSPKPFYAVKCNTDPVLLRTLAALGTGFDCASRNEIDIVMDMGVDPYRIIYANPCKTRSFITHAKERNVTMMTFDNAEELVKIANLHPDAELILRIAVSDKTATCPLNLKFGADPVTLAPQLLIEAKQLHLNVIGISFHVGSGCNDPSTFREALSHARNLCDVGEGLGFNMKLVDLGGGYPGSLYHVSFEENFIHDIEPKTKGFKLQIAAVIRSAMDDFFPHELGVRFVAEPGRFFAAAPFTLVCNVIHATEVSAEKITKNPEDTEHRGYMYYINDGVYGSFNCILFDHDEVAEEYPTTIWGPTCDSLDKIEVQDCLFMPRLTVVVYHLPM
ncbi:Pyridoxal-dependent decarboxylase, pyridoxal binding domain protein [Dictyocaulus viviparus]|uniref:ornithine decarboxylase n=1 Tax=Dictyocaulus viviparus TaxID=29172 RepID=A0A0D8Y469_DICVI|nr:Pyridoxal-dependent decarboxylase, pyridoxal binding domain protein [Dictyocaulus viviparus]